MARNRTGWRAGFFRPLLMGRDGPGASRRFSMLLSVLATLGIWLFFIKERGWQPPAGEEVAYSTYLHWVLLLYLGIQLISLIFAGRDGTKGEVFLDTVTSLAPMVLGFYVLVLHWTEYATLPIEQLRYAKSVTMVMVIDFLVDFALAMRAQKGSVRVSKAEVTLRAEP